MASKTALRRPLRPPRRRQTGQESPKTAKEAPKKPPKAPSRPKEAPKRPPRGPIRQVRIVSLNLISGELADFYGLVPKGCKTLHPQAESFFLLHEKLRIPLDPIIGVRQSRGSHFSVFRIPFFCVEVSWIPFFSWNKFIILN